MRSRLWQIARTSNLGLALAAGLSLGSSSAAQQPATPQSSSLPPVSTTATSVPIAITPMAGVTLSGAIEIPGGKAAIDRSGSVTAGDHAASVELPHRGFLKVCPTTKVNLLTDYSIAATMSPDETPGLMMALDRGAMEAYFATRKNSDVILTPSFRIVISGPGIAAVEVRLGAAGDMCVGNGGDNAPYVTVSSIFDGGVYRVNANQRVTFQHGSLTEVVDREKESCGCPPANPIVVAKANEFPLAQSEGLAPAPTPPPNSLEKGTVGAQATVNLSYDGTKPAGGRASASASSPDNGVLAKPKPEQALKPGFFHKVGRFFRKLFGG